MKEGFLRSFDPNIEKIRYDEQGLVPVIVQNASNGDVLILAYANEEAIKLTIETGGAHFWSRSRQELWHKGSTSGNIQRIVEIRVDCDADAILYFVEPLGAACHTGETSCFFRVFKHG